MDSRLASLPKHAARPIMPFKKGAFYMAVQAGVAYCAGGHQEYRRPDGQGTAEAIR